MRSITWISMLAAALLTTGCGGGGSSSTATTSTSDITDITVERGPILRAMVVDANGTVGNELGNGVYRFNHKPQYPIEVMGGYIDINRNNSIDASEIELPLVMRTHQGKDLTLLSSLAAESTIATYFQDVFGLSSDDLTTLTPRESLEVAAISDVLFQYCVENNVSDPSTIDVETLKTLETQMQSRIAEFKDSNVTLAETIRTKEMELVARLPLPPLGSEKIQTLYDINLSTTLLGTSIADLPKVTLTQGLIDSMNYMIEEEELARDIYEAFAQQWDLRIFEMIAKSEQTHMNKIEELFVKYEMNVSVDLTERGVYHNTQLQTLYTNLLAQGMQSANDALKVGVAIEEQDISDLNNSLVNAPEDFKVVYEGLMSGSYNHLDAFNNQINGIVGQPPRRKH